MKKTEVSIQDIIHALLAHIVFILISAIVVGAIAWAYTTYRIPKMYRTTVTFYAESIPEREENQITSSELTSNRQLAANCAYIMRSSKVMNRASEMLQAENIHISAASLKSMTTLATTNTAIFTATISSRDQENIALVANTIAMAGREVIVNEVIQNCNVIILDSAVRPGAPYAPNVVTNTITGVIVGLILACFIVIIRTLTDTTIWNEEDLAKQYDIPVLGSVPMLAAGEKTTGGKE